MEKEPKMMKVIYFKSNKGYDMNNMAEQMKSGQIIKEKITPMHLMDVINKLKFYDF